MANMGRMGNMGNMQGMMKQMQKLQKEMASTQDEINTTTFTGKSAQDLVTVDFTGDRKMTALNVNPEAIDPDDPDMLSDLVMEAVNDALGQIDQTTQSKMGKYTQGLPF
jgi:DNA-binding YbaB/EbfC family protein